jgi:hypothetical protein
LILQYHLGFQRTNYPVIKGVYFFVFNNYACEFVQLSEFFHHDVSGSCCLNFFLNFMVNRLGFLPINALTLVMIMLLQIRSHHDLIDVEVILRVNLDNFKPTIRRNSENLMHPTLWVLSQDKVPNIA